MFPRDAPHPCQLTWTPYPIIQNSTGLRKFGTQDVKSNFLQLLFYKFLINLGEQVENRGILGDHSLI